ncbi:hypothetical protein SISSUDRAFT_1047947 [Sistotremastrum suecicum HHB10207 ss-3]|uniref:Uncharacterized protein n=1 Tax=Sistotremastrum suecicum HHB10207 ss-3 TaxID=1314776 RepID=A0A166CVB5_9AGAM|nr:hypothetical protein SISSUDRAFT_1047947 [Sistotremastrum suecicum HHB10207 ss-3]
MASNPPAAPVVVGTHPQLIRGYQLDPSRLEPYKAIQLQIHRAQRLEGFGPTFPELPRLVYLTIFNCHPTSQAIEHARKFPPPADWVCPWPEPDPSSGTILICMAVETVSQSPYYRLGDQ